MICNIIDSRHRPYRWKRLNAIIEATEHDDNVPDSDRAPDFEDGTDFVVYDQREGVSLAEALAWANGQKCPVTLYLYDEGDGTTVRKPGSGAEPTDQASPPARLFGIFPKLKGGD